ncbi:PIN domain-containing protein [Chitinilyticum aquatile]|uniref:PIN domain-containing protein n=1 Tax=Chitinilyticum aquatile TaxID=362520 RepID=UPI0009D6B798|nr:PIN domain-containing protein [Chitinilyticum aquatile]
MKLGSIILDTNLLLLYVVGSVSRSYIAKHKRLTSFTEQDFDVLSNIVRNSDSVVLTPNILTETSNLAANIADPAKTEIFVFLGCVIAELKESYIASCEVSSKFDFLRLGLTDASLVEVSSPELIVITADLDLHCAIQGRGDYSINFNHIRDGYL